MMDWDSLLRRNAEHLQEGLEVACSLCHRRAEDITVMAVSKNLPADAVTAAYKAGFRLFGENRVQEASDKWNLGAFSDARLELIGHLQSNKAKAAVEVFDGVQSLDSDTTARELSRRASQAGKQLQVLLEFNTSNEMQKYGVRGWKELADLAALVQTLPNLKLEGVMTMAAFVTDEKIVRRCFAQLREIAERLRQETALPLPILSMGMSQDYHWAIMEGSNLVRIGTLLFGSRS